MRHRRKDSADGRQAHSGRRRAAFMPDNAHYPPQEGFAFHQPEDDPWQAAFIPQAQGQLYYDQQPGQPEVPEVPEAYFEDYQEEAAGKRNPQPGGKPPRRGRWALVALVSLLIIIGLGLYVFSLSRADQAFSQKMAALRPNVFYEGIYVDGYPIGGMSQAQASSALSQHAGQNERNLSITLKVDEASWQITQQQLPFRRNTEAVLEEAWSIGRQGFSWMMGDDATPFEVRHNHVQQTKKDKAYFTTQVTYDAQSLRALCESIASQVNRAPVNAVIASFDFSTRAFTVTRDVPGREISVSALMEPLSQALDRGEYQAVISVISTPLLPRVTSSDLQNSFAMLASFSTKTTSDNDRNNNIALAAQALNAKTLMPGETLSFNEATGQRTLEKGYRGAPAIAGGVLIDDVGGGVCQVSSTLFNAAALAGMTIVDRSPHAWPSSYVDKGLDATVNWPNLDFKFRNDKDTPVFLIAYYDKRQVTVEVFGMRTGPGESVQLQTEVTSTSVPPPEPLLQPNPSLAPGSQQELKQARTGYVVDTYRLYLRDGVAYRREKLFTSRYPMVQQVIEYN